MQVGRVVTVVLQVVESEPASAIWDRHLDRGLLVGCRVMAIGDGNAFDEDTPAEDEDPNWDVAAASCPYC